MYFRYEVKKKVFFYFDPFKESKFGWRGSRKPCFNKQKSLFKIVKKILTEVFSKLLVLLIKIGIQLMCNFSRKQRYPFYDVHGRGQLLYGYGGPRLYPYTKFKQIEGYYKWYSSVVNQQGCQIPKMWCLLLPSVMRQVHPCNINM